MAKKQNQLSRFVASDSFERTVLVKTFELSASESTRLAYWRDFRYWMEFCRARGVDPTDPMDGSVVAWVEAMKGNTSSKTRARRLSALSSIYRELKRARPPLVKANPFSIDEGPRRERALVQEPTPIATPQTILKLLGTCTDSILGKRDLAIIRILWSTGMRRASLLSMTFERMRRGRDGYEASVVGKGSKHIRVLIRGKASESLAAWLDELAAAKLTTGPIWRTKQGPMTVRAVGHMLDRRAALAGVKDPISPHTFRVAFLTYNPAGIDAKQDAAGHADPATTKLYDRASWRGREAFEQMPELEDVEE